jgi:UDP-glucose 4-epimerase
MRLVITGSTGYLAWFIVRALCERHELDCWVRPGPEDSDGRLTRLQHPHVRYRSVNMRDAFAVQEALVGVVGIVHLAYAHVPGKYRDGHGDDLGGWMRANLDMQWNLLLGAHAQGVRDFVLMSSRAVYGDGPGPFGEGDTPRPDTHYGGLKLACEALGAGFNTMRFCAIRCTGVYGCVEPLSASKWFDLLRAIHLSGRLQGDRIGTEVHGTDVARIIALLIERPGPWPAIVNASDLAVSHSMIADAYSKRTGRRIQMGERAREVRGPMTCAWIARQGLALGGSALLARTLDRLIDGARALG